jgi:RNA polymerase sigma-70 factor, ECF subfamily
MSLSEILQPPGSSVHDYPHQTDEHLLALHLKGDPYAFAVLVDRYRVELFQFLARFLGDPVEAEDIFQETFLQIHQSAAQFDPGRQFRPWAFTIAANKARDHHRVQTRHRTSSLDAPLADEDSGKQVDLLESALPPPTMELELQETRQEVKTVLDQLNTPLKEVILLAYFHQFSYQEISQMLNIPLGTVKSRLHGAIAAFAEMWKIIHQKN